MVHRLSNEPGPPAWQVRILPLNQPELSDAGQKNTTKTIIRLQNEMIPLTEKHNLYHCKLSSSLWIWTWHGMFSPVEIKLNRLSPRSYGSTSFSLVLLKIANTICSHCCGPNHPIGWWALQQMWASCDHREKAAMKYVSFLPRRSPS